MTMEKVILAFLVLMLILAFEQRAGIKWHWKHGLKEVMASTLINVAVLIIVVALLVWAVTIL